MYEKYVSEKLLRELPRPLLNFLWYLWDTYSYTDLSEVRILLRGTEDANGQCFTVHTTSETIIE